MATFSLDHTRAWVQADLDADPGQWALGVIWERAEQQQIELPDDQAELLADVMVPALEAAQKEDVPPVMLLFLLPEADEPAVCSVSIRAEAVPSGVTVEDLMEEFRLPDEMLEQPSVEETVPTATGPATHLIQRYRAPVDVEHELVQEHEVFVWQVTDVDGDMAVYLSTSYVDLDEAQQWRPELLELAQSLAVTADD